MLVDDAVYLGQGESPQYLKLKYANRHGLVTGATGTGKTVSLQVMAEGFAAAGVPVFCADIKGDLAGLALAGEARPALVERAAEMGFEDYRFAATPVLFWDLFGEQGHPLRTTVSQMGPLLLARVLDLNPTQEGVLNIAFKLADDEGLLLLDLKDLRALLTEVGERAKDLSLRYGNVSGASVGAIQRALLVLEQQGGESFFGERALEIGDLMRATTDGRGYVSVLAAARLMRAPRLYATFLLWLLSELFESLPEMGDPDRPRLVFFFDEAHLLFDGASKALVDTVETVVKLIRSKGVGVYFVTQNPADIPEPVLAQLSNRVQHALRAYTPAERRAVRAAADSFRPNPAFSTETVIGELKVGEALVSTLGDKGVPSVVERTMMRPPSSRMGTITDEERARIVGASPVGTLYDSAVDRESAYEMLAAAAVRRAEDAEWARRQDEMVKEMRRSAPRPSNRQSVGEAAVKSFTRSMASRLAGEVVRGVLGGLTRKR